MADISCQEIIKTQRDVLQSIFYDEYLKDFIRFEEYVCSTLFNTKVLKTHKPRDINSVVEYTSVLNKHLLDKHRIQELITKYSKQTHDRKLESITLPTVSFSIKGDRQHVTEKIHEYCNDWLKHKLEHCKHLKSVGCELAVNTAYNTILTIINKPGDMYKNIYELISNIDLKDLDQLYQQTPLDTTQIFKPLCKDCESKSMFYINKHLTSTHTNLEKMLAPLGMYLCWHGVPVDKQHIHKCSHTQ